MQAVRLTRESGRNFIDTSKYPQYLESIRDRLPPGALTYAAAPWHYDFYHERCSHDANLLSLTLTGSSLPESRAGGHPGSLELKLVGSHRNGILRFLYAGLGQLVLSNVRTVDDLGDVLVDEISLAETGLVVHEIVFENATLTIETAELTSYWEPIDPHDGCRGGGC
jgi:hypothetical protein